MPDTEISRLPSQPAALVDSEDVLAIVHIAASETRKVKAVDLVNRAFDLLPDDSIDADKIDWGTGDIGENVVDGKGIKNRSIAGAKLILDTITATEIAPNAIGSSELGNQAVDTAAIQNASVTAEKLAADLNGDAILAAGSVNLALAENSVGSTELADLSVNTAAIQNGAVTEAKLSTNLDGDTILAAGSVNTALADLSVNTRHIVDAAVITNKLAASSVTNAKISDVSGSKLTDASVTDSKIVDLDGSKLTDNTVADSKLQTGIDGSKISSATISETQLNTDSVTADKIKDAAVTNDKLASNINGAKLNNGSVPAAALRSSDFTDGVKLDGTVQIDNAITAGTANGITYNEQGLITATTNLSNSDIPIATTSLVGGIYVPVASGLTISGTGEIGQQNNITPGTVSGITFNNHGFITAVNPLTSVDLPPATTTTLGAVIVPDVSSSPLLVDDTGNLTHSLSTAVAGSYVSVTTDAYGLVQGGSTVLNASQVPGLDASKITTGEFGTARIADSAITMQKLADYSVSFIQEAEPSVISDILHIGCRWYQPSTSQERIYTGNVWAPIGFGRLSQDNLRFGGIVDGSTGNIVNLTDAGRTAGLNVSDPLPVATDPLGGLYFVVSPGGNAISVTPSITYDAGDWCLCVNATDGWIRIDTLSGGGGGGGLISLNDLLDVDINDAKAGDTLIYDPVTNNWVNRTTTADRVTLSPAFDGSTTAFSTSIEIIDQNNMLLSVGGVLLEPGVDFTIASGTRLLNFASPPPEGSSYWAVNQQTVNSGGGGGGTSLPPGTAANEYLQWNNALGSWGPASELDGGSF